MMRIQLPQWVVRLGGGAGLVLALATVLLKAAEGPPAVPPVILSQPPQNLVAQYGTPVQLEVAAVDPNVTSVLQGDQLSYEWRRDDWPCFRIARNTNSEPPFTAAPSPSGFTVSTSWDKEFLYLTLTRPPGYPPGTNTYPIAVGSPPAPVVLSWRTNAGLFLPAVSFDDVGTYTVIVRCPGGLSVTSAPVHLSVYELKVGSNGGTLSTPIGIFTPTSSTANGVTFNRKYLYTPFDGPGKTAPVSTQFPNPGQYPQLQVDTKDARNPTSLNTLIQIVENSFTGPVLAWNDNNVPPSGDQRSLAVGNLGINKQYRVAVWYVSPPPAGVTQIYFNWKYTGMPEM